MIGFEAFNEQGFKIIGSDYANLVFYGRTDVQVVGGQSQRSSTGQIHYWDAYAYAPNDGATLRFYRAQFPVVEQGGLIRAPTGNIGGVVECYAFGPPLPAQANSGLEVYHPDGRLMFNTARPFLKLAGVHADHNAGLLSFKHGYSYPAAWTGITAGKIAWAVAAPRYIYVKQQFGGSRKFTDEFEYIVACRVADNGYYHNYACQFGATNRINGWVGTYDHVPGTGPIKVLCADVSAF